MVNRFPLGQDLPGFTPFPDIGIGQQLHQGLVTQSSEVFPGNRWGAWLVQAIDAAIGLVPGVERVKVGGAFVIPIHHIDTGIRPNQQVDRTEPRVTRVECYPGVRCGE